MGPFAVAPCRLSFWGGLLAERSAPVHSPCREPAMTEVAMPKAKTRFVVLVYRMPSKPTAGRVWVWRQLKKVGAIYLQQSVCVFPDLASVRGELQAILARIEDGAGEFHLLPLRQLSAEEERKLVEQFLEQTSKHYQEIIENCEVNFQKEIDFETFRKNFTYEEAEEIRTEFDKIVDWFHRVRARDWFGAPNRNEAADWLERCQERVEEFEGRVFAAQDAVAPGGSVAQRRLRGEPPPEPPGREQWPLAPDASGEPTIAIPGPPR